MSQLPRTRTLAGAAATAFCAAVASGQTVVPASDADLTFNSTASFSGFAESIAIVSDHDADGWRDIVVGAISFDSTTESGTLVNAGAAFLFSGRTGAIIRRFDGVQTEATLGFDAVEIADQDGDGVRDLAISAPRLDGDAVDVGGFVVYSAATGTVLDTVYGTFGADAKLGWSMRAIGDANGDGLAEFAAGAPDAGGVGAVVVYDGATLDVLATLEGQQTHAGFGWSVSGAGDVNGDGAADLIVGSPFFDTENLDPEPGDEDLIPDSGRAYVYSGGDFSLLYTLERHDLTLPNETFSAFQNFGTRVDGVGDVDGDGRADVIVGAPETTQGQGGGAGHVMVFSGVDGSVIYDIDGPQVPSEKHGERVTGTGDLDGDGVGDFAASSSQACWMFPGCGGAGRVIVYSGATGEPLMSYEGEDSNDSFGASTAAADLNDDGGIDLLIGAIFHNATPVAPGEVYRFMGEASGRPVPGDLDGDGAVNVADLLELLSAWGTCRTACPADLDASGTVDVADLLVLLAAWT